MTADLTTGAHSNRTRQHAWQAVLAVLVLLALAVLAFMYTSMASGEGAVSADDAQDEANETVEPAAVVDIAGTTDVVLTRDPFEPVVPEPVEEPVAPTDPADPSDPSQPIDPSQPSQPGIPGIPEAELLDVVSGSADEPIALIKVGTTTYEVRVGERFAGVFLLIEIDGECATWLRGDTVQARCVGDSVK